MWDLPCPFCLYTHFDQNQELGHIGKLTPPQCGQIPEMPIAVCFGAEKFAGGNFFEQLFLAENGPTYKWLGSYFQKFKWSKNCPIFEIDPTTFWTDSGNAKKLCFGSPVFGAPEAILYKKPTGSPCSATFVNFFSGKTFLKTFFLRARAFFSQSQRAGNKKKSRATLTWNLDPDTTHVLYKKREKKEPVNRT